MKDIEETQHRLALLAGGLQGLGLSMSIHNMPGNGGITSIHAQCLSHLVESCGYLASHLADELEDHIAAMPGDHDEDEPEPLTRTQSMTAGICPAQH